MCYLVDLDNQCPFTNCVKNVFIVEKGGRKFSLIPLQNEDFSRRNLSIGSQVELEDSKKVGDQCGK